MPAKLGTLIFFTLNSLHCSSMASVCLITCTALAWHVKCRQGINVNMWQKTSLHWPYHAGTCFYCICCLFLYSFNLERYPMNNSGQYSREPAVFPFQKHVMLKGFRSRGDRFTHSSGTQSPQLGSEKIHEPFIALSRYPYELLWIYCKAEKS